MKITIEQLHVLVSVNHSGSFSKTAELLGQTPSAISRKISQLEAQLNVSLFTRTTRRISLTDDGKRITEQAQHILAVLENMHDSAPNAQPQGKIKIDAPTPFIEHCIMPFIDEFMALYPKIDIELASFDRQIDLIEQQVDVAFRIGQLQDSSLHYRKIGRSPLRILASPEYLKQHGQPQHVDELTQHRCIGFSQPISLNQWPLKSARGNSFAIKPQLSMESGSLIRQAALNGLGIVCLADFMTASDIKNQALTPVLVDATLSQYQPINAVFYQPYQGSLKLKCFIDFIVEKLAASLY
ncbi:LysR substrate-binding domain-containing protein [Shewanella intestini]|uniref:LysR family transcriptional regulator n=1 Tax=Shewanella intestini TaxID=2017544 RepID=A0ABS5I3F5_9GAMM|nr:MULTISPECIES: LysR family transcriptional regulator [Shewanella]MBR9728436.1 LysR family transcriptional regulator [Shewanella intestini]